MRGAAVITLGMRKKRGAPQACRLAAILASPRDKRRECRVASPGQRNHVRRPRQPHSGILVAYRATMFLGIRQQAAPNAVKIQVFAKPFIKRFVAGADKVHMRSKMVGDGRWRNTERGSDRSMRNGRKPTIAHERCGRLRNRPRTRFGKVRNRFCRGKHIDKMVEQIALHGLRVRQNAAAESSDAHIAHQPVRRVSAKHDTVELFAHHIFHNHPGESFGLRVTVDQQLPPKALTLFNPWRHKRMQAGINARLQQQLLPEDRRLSPVDRGIVKVAGHNSSQCRAAEAGHG